MCLLLLAKERSVPSRFLNKPFFACWWFNSRLPGDIGAAGFTAAGVTAGSIAAATQSAVCAGATTGVFSAAQSAGAAGIGMAGNAVIGTIGAGVGKAIADSFK